MCDAAEREDVIRARLDALNIDLVREAVELLPVERAAAVAQQEVEVGELAVSDHLARGVVEPQQLGRRDRALAGGVGQLQAQQGHAEHRGERRADARQLVRRVEVEHAGQRRDDAGGVDVGDDEAAAFGGSQRHLEALDVADVGFPDRRGGLQLRVHAPQLCDELTLDATLEASARVADLDLALGARGFRPQRFRLPAAVEDWIEEARVVDVELSADLRAEALKSAPKVPAVAGDLSFSVALDGQEHSALEATFGPTDPTADGFVSELALSLRADGLVESLALTDGRLELTGERAAATVLLKPEERTVAAALRTRCASALQECACSSRAEAVWPWISWRERTVIGPLCSAASPLTTARIPARVVTHGMPVLIDVDRM